MEVYHVSLIGPPVSEGLTSGWSWSKAQSTQPLLALGTTGNAVSILTAQGTPWTPAKGAIKNVRGTEAACLSWHPTLLVLAIAWQDGAVSVWDAARNHLEEDSKVHRQLISHLEWDDTGSYLLTVDTLGKVALWEVNDHSQPQLRSSIVSEKGGTVTHVAWGSQSASTGPGNKQAAVAYYAVSTPDSSTVTLRWLNELGQTGVVQDVGESLLALLCYPERQQLVAVTSSGSAILLASSTTSKAAHNKNSTGEWAVLMKVKFAGMAGGARLQVCWAGPHTLATAVDKDSTIRLMQLDTDDNYVLDVGNAEFTRADTSKESEGSPGSTAGITALAYEPRQQTMAAATTEGRVCLFRRMQCDSSDDSASDPVKQWEPQQTFQVGETLSTVRWGPTAQLLGVQSAGGIHICTRAPLHHKVCEGYALIQSTGQVLLEKLAGPPVPTARLTTQLKIAGLDVTAHTLLVHDGRKAQVYRIGDGDSSLNLMSEFEAPAGPASDPVASAAHKTAVTVTTGVAGTCSMALYNDSVYRTADHRVEVCNLSGVVKQTLTFNDSQGQPVLLDAQNEYLAVLTSTAIVRVFRAAGREAKPHAGPGPLVPANVMGSLQIEAISINCNGSMVCAVASLSGSGGCQDPRLFVYSAETNSSMVFDFTNDLRAPQVAIWDARDSRLLAVQMVALTHVQGNSTSRPTSSESATPNRLGQAADAETQQDRRFQCTAAMTARNRGLEVAVLFATAEAGVLLQEYQSLPQLEASGFLGVAAPHLLVHRKTMLSMPGTPPHSSNVTRVALQGFTGMEDADDALRQGLLDFNYHLAVGKLEEAFKAVAALRSPAVWRSMAHMAIRNKRLDVAEHCLGNMEHVRGSRALREGGEVSELDARVGLVAVQLGLADDAARLFAACDRWDLLEQLHQAQGKWDAALDCAAKKDRIHLQSVQYAQARHLEAIGDYKSAIQHYIDSGTAAVEVPRMLWQQGELPGLEQHVLQSADAGLLTWWAHYCESQGKFDKALSCYQRAGNQLAVLRIHCATGNWQAAEGAVAETQDPAAAFHLARLYEAQNKVEDALRCYGISKRYSHGARLAKRCGMDQELLSLALKSPPNVMLEAADYLLASGNTAAAAVLYQKGGHLAKALEMAFNSGLYDVLDRIAEAIDQSSNPRLMNRCAEAFISAGHHGKAVQMLVRAGQPERALDLLLGHDDVPLTEELAEALTPEKKPDNADSRTATLMRIAQAAKHQGLYHLACKKYTQAGDRLKAMRALVKSRDTEKIVFFAGVSKQREVYIMAANFLQTLDWRSNPDYLKNILNFYTKAGAADSLAGFYMGCAQMEIDEYKEYGKALQALQEAAKHLTNSRTSDKDTQKAVLQQCSDRIRRFSAAQDQLATEPAAAVAVLQQLLQEVPEKQAPVPDVRLGDIYGLLVEWCYQQGSLPQAMQLLQQMIDRGITLQTHLAETVIAEIYQANGLAVPDHSHDNRQQQPVSLTNPGTAAAGDEVVDEVQDLPHMQDEEYTDQ